MSSPARVIPFERLRMTDIDQVGGKNASLGEMIGQLAGAGIRVPGGFATTAAAFREFLEASDLTTKIRQRLAKLDITPDVIGGPAMKDKLEREIRNWSRFIDAKGIKAE